MGDFKGAMKKQSKLKKWWQQTKCRHEFSIFIEEYSKYNWILGVNRVFNVYECEKCEKQATLEDYDSFNDTNLSL